MYEILKNPIAIKMNPPINIHPASFRDPAGYIFKKGDLYYRFISNSYKTHYKLAISNNVFKEAIEKKLLLPFEEAEIESTENPNCYKILFPKQVSFLSYPWEWSYDQLRDAALVTLELCRPELLL